MRRIDREVPQRFLRTGYEPDDWVAVLLKSYGTGGTAQRIVPVSTVLEPRFQAWLRFSNVSRCNVYVSVNAVTPGRSRTRDAIAAVRHVFLDVDQDAPRFLRALTGPSDLPSPAYLVHTSPGRLQAFWRIRACAPALAEGMQKRLARELGADAAATSCAQMCRLPGFVNYKHESPSLVTVEYRASDAIVTVDDFPQSVVGRSSVEWAPPGAPPFVSGQRDVLARARQYLASSGPAVSGHHGDDHTFRICCRLVRGFALCDEEALSVLAEWNARCEPPWSSDELQAKVRHARSYGREPLGGLLARHGERADNA